jgi:hypothetical protein
MNDHATMPFGKWQDYDIREVMTAEPSYLAWFFVCVEDGADEDLMRSIAALPDFGACLERFVRKARHPDVLARIPAALRRYEAMTAPACSAEELDSLCDRLFNAPPDVS